ncbi:MAG TPA: TIGR00730 family Rossman fold protein, partial [Thermoanaerobaculia bacterium]|nr:TIGR00730 family Rossman fold protein [Thermoanaerobaculia bacterium]
MKRLCVFAGSSTGRRDSYAAAARELAREAVARGYGIVYGGGRVGLMGILADAALEAGGEVIGIIPQSLATKELAHARLARLEVVASMHQRKARMAELSTGFVALPGGAGTLEETFEVYTWAQLGLHRKPCGMLDVDGYWDHLGRLLDRAVEEGFLRTEHRRMLLIETDCSRLL